MLQCKADIFDGHLKRVYVLRNAGSPPVPVWLSELSEGETRFHVDVGGAPGQSYFTGNVLMTFVHAESSYLVLHSRSFLYLLDVTQSGAEAEAYSPQAVCRIVVASMKPSKAVVVDAPGRDGHPHLLLLCEGVVYSVVLMSSMTGLSMSSPRVVFRCMDMAPVNFLGLRGVIALDNEGSAALILGGALAANVVVKLPDVAGSSVSFSGIMGSDVSRVSLLHGWGGESLSS